MLGWLLGTGEKSPDYWRERDAKEKEQHKKAVNKLKGEIAEAQYLTNSTNREIEITELQTELVEGQIGLANTQTQLVNKGAALSKKIDGLNNAQAKYRQAIQANRKRSFLGF